MSKLSFTVGSVLRDATLAIVHDGYCRYEKKTPPHEWWMVMEMKGRRVKLCAAIDATDLKRDLWSETIEQEDLIRGITTVGTRLSVYVMNPIERLVEEIDPPQGAVRFGQDFRFLPDSERKILEQYRKVYRFRIGEDYPDDGTRHWLLEKFMKHELVQHWDNGLEGVPLLTLSNIMVVFEESYAEHIEYNYRTLEEGRKVRDEMSNALNDLIAKHGFNYPVSQLFDNIS